MFAEDEEAVIPPGGIRQPLQIVNFGFDGARAFAGSMLNRCLRRLALRKAPRNGEANLGSVGAEPVTDSLAFVGSSDDFADELMRMLATMLRLTTIRWSVTTMPPSHYRWPRSPSQVARQIDRGGPFYPAFRGQQLITRSGATGVAVPGRHAGRTPHPPLSLFVPFVVLDIGLLRNFTLLRGIIVRNILEPGIYRCVCF